MNAILNNQNAVEVQSEPLMHGRTAVASERPRVSIDEEGAPIPASNEPRNGKSNAGRKSLIAVVAALPVVGLVLWQHSSALERLANTTREKSMPAVFTVKPQAAPHEMEIQLPGNLTAYTEAAIYARTNGYIKAWYTDLGAKLEVGQLMAEIEAPDVDVELRQAMGRLSQARAALDIGQLNFNRAKYLLATKVFSQLEFDQNQTTFDAQKAAVEAAEAKVQNLTAQKGFQKVTAPFTGVVTRRETDVGMLINAGSDSPSGSAQELFHVARTDILRVFISVPEVDSFMVKLDTPAWLDLAESPGLKFHGKVVHIAGAINSGTRTLLTEVLVPNEDGRLYPSAHAMVHLVLNLENPPSVIPINTVLFRSQGAQVAVVDDANIAHLRNVTVGRDFGTSYEVTSGIGANDRLILDPSDSLAEGEKVAVQTAPSGKP